MAPNQDLLERQLKQAKTVLASRAKKLADEGVDAATRKRDPKWRHLSAECSHIESRMKAAKMQVALTQELQQRKVDKAAAAAAPPAEEVKEKKEKKPKKEKSEKKAEKADKPKKKKEEAAEE